MTKRHPKPTPEQNAGRLFRKAAQVLRDRKWIKGEIGNKDYGMCLRGALTFTLIGNAQDECIEAESIFTLWMKENYTNGFSTVPSWNDHHARNKETVILWMDKFADAVDPQRR